ncbi:MAG: SGNH/GDSL hydrolase family protein [Acidobacteriia bacterium]|nr:SGNH/GDSL hydrolase family protein [Terriglobia bacterium]
MFRTLPGHYPATLVALMRSRAVLYNPGVTGYYERLLGGPTFLSARDLKERSMGTLGAVYVYDRSFRMRRFRPNLKGLRNVSEPQGLTTNSFGIVGPECSMRKPPNTRRVALLGDSVAMGWGADQNRSFVRLLEDSLNATRPNGDSRRFEILNFSTGGYELTQMLDVAEEDIPGFEPDVYVLSLTELAVFRNWDEHLAGLVKSGIDPKYDFLRDTIRQSGASSSDSARALFGKLAPFRIAVLRRILTEIQSRAARSHAPFIVVLVPTLEDGDMNRRRFSGIPELLASLAIPTVDLRDTFDGILDVEPLRSSVLDVHPNIQGHAMISANLYAKLRAQPELWAALVGSDSRGAKDAPASPAF